MTPEQMKKLAGIEEALCDVFIAESQTEEWPDMETKEGRGDRYWHKRNALATLTIVGRLQVLLRDARSEQPPQAPREESIEDEAERLEKLGVSLLRKRSAKRAAG